MEKLKKLYKFICRAEEVVAGTFMVLIMIIVFMSGVGRAIGKPLNWAVDLSRFLFAWTVFLAGDVAMRKNRHANVKFLVRKLPEKVQYYISILNYFLIIIFLGYLFRYGIIQTLHERFRSYQGIPGFSYSWAILSVPVGSLLLMITAGLKIRKIIKDEQAILFKMEQKEKISGDGN